jgi:rhodanese-related sulfurtransferase
VTELPDDPAVQILDMRPAALVQTHPLPRNHVINIPFPTLRQQLDKLDRNRPVVTVCALGKTSYFGARILAQHGFNVQSLIGGIRAHYDPRTPAKLPTP